MKDKTRKLSSSNMGFTIVELLIVIVIIAILAALIIITYSGIQQRAANAKRTTDIAQLSKAIRAARENQNKTLTQITGNTCTGCPCVATWGNPTLAEPRELNKTTNWCWTDYYDTLTAIANASGTNLNSLRNGDPRGNPYLIDENEGEDAGNPCNRDYIESLTGNGVATGAPYTEIPLYNPPSSCT